MVDLALCTEDDLWEELCKRNSSCVLLTLQDLTAQEESRAIFYHGGFVTSLGLLEWGKRKMLLGVKKSDDE